MSHSKNITIRPYLSSDAQDLVNIYYNTCHKVLIQNYTQAQVNALAPPEKLQVTGWARKWSELKPLVATCDHQLVGFAEFEANGHIDCFYCHHEWIGMGVGTLLMNTILDKAHSDHIKRIYAEVSLTARPFFYSKGFTVVKQQTIERKGVQLINFIMEKWLDDKSHPEKT